MGLARTCRHRALLGKKISLGKNVVFAKQVELRVPEYVKIGDNVYFGAWFVAETNLEIGSDVLISSRVACIGNDHAFEDAQKTIITGGGLTPGAVVLGGDNLIGFGTIIIVNSRIGKGCIVGAGSVVTGDLPANTICAGVPARPIRPRYGQSPMTSSQ